MRATRVGSLWVPGCLLLILGVIGIGCCSPNVSQLVAPTVLTVAPVAASNTACPNAVITIVFSEAMNPATINATTVTLTGPGTTPVTGVVAFNAKTYTATFTPSALLAAGTTYTTGISTGATDQYGIAMATPFAASFTTAANGCHPPPTVLSVVPALGSATACPNAPVVVTFSEAMNPASITPADFTLSGGITGTVTHDVTNSIYTLTPSTILASGTLYTVNISSLAEDTYGNFLVPAFTSTFTTAANGCHPPPTVLSVVPALGSTTACPNAPVVVTFSEAMNPASINAADFTLSGGVIGTVTHDITNSIYTLTPSSVLASGTLYTVNISSLAEDTYGNFLVPAFTSTFTTAANGCHPAPLVTGVSPLAGAVGICPNTIITATFNEAMNPVSINATNFTVTAGGLPVAGVVSYTATTDTAIFTPTAALALSTLFTATVTTGVEDTYGNFLAARYTWTFTTGATSCLPPSPPILVSPAAGATGICPLSVVSATFPQAMNPLTLNTTTFTVSAGGVNVLGVVTGDVTNKIFTFTPTAPLALSTLYTATITTGAQNPAGIGLAANYVWTFTTGATNCTGAAPVVVTVSPLAGSVGVCPNSPVSATFSIAMNPATINTTTFLLSGETGVVTLDSTHEVALYTPTANLALDTTYTATITTGAQSSTGTPLAANYVWNFTTALQPCQPPVPLGTAANFEILAGTTVTSVGPTTITGGDLGLSPGTAVTGFPPGTLVPPAVMYLTDPIAAQAQLDLTVAYNYAAGLPNGAVLPANLAGLTFTPGLYTNATTVQIGSGTFTLNAQGNPNAVFIFQVGTTLTTIGTTQIVLAGGAQAKNVFWQVGTSATLGTNSIFNGTIMALQSITIQTGAVLNGRALASNGAVTLDSNVVTAP